MDINAFVNKLPGVKMGGIAIHNVLLLNVENRTDQPDGCMVLVVEHDGQRQELRGHDIFHYDRLKQTGQLVGQVGYLKPRYTIINEIPTITFHFYDYMDQSLRRVPELDLDHMPYNSDGRKENVVGWTCEMIPNGFLAPIGVIPGNAGGFMSDDTEAVTIRVPKDFFRVCRRYKSTPKDVLSGFIADIINAQNYLTYPRADGYQSHGSDEREYANSWLLRAYGHDEVDLEAIEEEESNKEWLRDELLSMFDDHLDNDGNGYDFVSQVRDMVDIKK